MKNILTLITALIFSTITSFTGNVKNMIPVQTRHAASLPQTETPDVLGDTTGNESVTFNVDAIFNKALIIKGGKITADNIVYGIRAGSGISVDGGQTPVITNTGVLSLQGKTGELKLESGTGITIDGLKISNSGITSLSAGGGISVSGSTITNSDLGSSQKIFKTISVTGQDDIVAGSNTDTLTFVAGTGITLSTGIASNALTISSNDPSVAAGWTKLGTNIFLTTSTDSVGIGTTSPTHKLEVLGTGSFSDTLTAGALEVTGATTLTGALSANGNVTLGNATTDSLTFVGRIANGTSLLPDTDLGSNLGSSGLRFDNLYVANINSNSSQNFSGQTTFSYPPTDTTINQATVLINPASSVANGQLLGLGINGYEKAVIDAEGDMVLGYSDLASAPVTNNPLMIYGHNGTNVTSIDTGGNLVTSGNADINGSTNDIAGTLNLSGGALTSSGALTISPTTGDNINFNLSGAGDFVVNSNQLYVDTSSGYVGIGTTTPTSNLDISATSGTDALRLTASGSKVLGLSYATNAITLDAPSSTEPTNKLSNGTFESDLTSWSSVPSYTLNDQFTTSAPTTLVSGGLSAPSPTVGSEISGDVGFDNDAYWTKGTGITISGSKANWTNTVSSALSHSSLLTLFSWYQMTYDVDSMNQNTFKLTSFGPSSPQVTSVVGTNTKTGWTNTTTLGLQSSSNGGFTAVVDNMSFKPLTLSSLFSTVVETTANKIISAGVTLTPGTQAGIVVNADATFANFIIAYHDGTNIHLDKNVGGTYTSLINTAATYAADRQIKVIKNGNVYKLIYNGTQIGADQTISDAGIVNNTLQGLFSTYASNSFTNFLITTNLDGTSAEPTGGTRTVVDTNGYLSITGGKAIASNAGIGDPRLYNSLTVNRVAGLVGLGTYRNTGNQIAYVGFNSGTNSIPSMNSFIQNGGNLQFYDGTVNSVTIGTVTSTDTYQTAIVLRNSGAYYYIKGGTFTNWTLTWIGSVGATSSLSYGFAARSGASEFDNLKIPTATWLPTPLAYDTFTRADGAISSSETTGPDSQATTGLAWTGGAISSNKNVITPSLGSELIDTFTNSPFNPYETFTTSGATVASAINTTGAALMSKNIGAVSLGQWYFIDANITINSGTAPILRSASDGNAGGTSNFDINYNFSGRTLFSYRISTARSNDYTTVYPAGSPSVNYSNITVSQKLLTLSSLFSTVSTSDSDVIADANVTLTAGTQAGLVLNLDSTSSPANFVIAYHDGTKVYFEKNVAGTYTSLFTAVTTAYVAGATLRVTKDGTAYRVYYNNALIGTATVSDAGIISNTKHGLFSTYSGNSFDNFTLWPRGSSTTKFTDAPFEELVSTRDTTTTYNNSTGSVKLVASGTDANYTQSVNVGDTQTYTETAYAYTNGSAVTSSDLSLYYDTAAITTSYSPLGSTGWYKLTGTLTGAASAKSFGVRIKAGKTVYVDNITVTPGVGNSNTLFLTNSGTGTMKLSVQDTTTLNAGSNSSQALIVKGYSTGQTANLQEWQNSGGTTLGSVSNAGLATFNTLTSNSLTANVALGGEGLILASGGVTKMALKYLADGSVAMDIPTASGNNKFTNSNFDSGISSWNYGNTLEDQFTTAAPTTLVSGVSTLTNSGVIAPSLGSQLVTNGNMETGNPPSNWSIAGATRTGVADERTGGNDIQSIDVVGNTGGGGMYQDLASATGTWLYFDGWGKNISGTSYLLLYGGAGFTNPFFQKTVTSSWTNIIGTGRATSNTPRAYLYTGNTAMEGRFDDISVKPLTLSSLFSSVDAGTAKAIVSADVTLTAGTQAGVVMNLDSASTPSNFIIAYHDGTNAHLEKVVAGTYTSLINAAATYGAGRTIKIVRDASGYSLFYNGTQIGTTQNITDAGIISNTTHGLFSTYASNSFANFLVQSTVNGSLATDGVSTRTVTDSNGKLSITGGQLSEVTGGVGWGNPSIYYPAITRSAGKILLGKINKTSGHTMFGFNTTTSSYPTESGIYPTDSVIQGYIGGVGISSVSDTSVNGTDYNFAIVLRTSGVYWYAKGGVYTNWTLIWIDTRGNAATLYPYFTGYTTTVLTADNIRIPTSTWLPTPLAYDTFTRADGAISSSETTGPDSQATTGLIWTGGAISTNKNVITPELGSELWDAPAAVFTSGTYNWLANGTNTIANVSNALQITYVDQSNGAYDILADSKDLSSNLTVGAWYLFSTDASINTGSSNLQVSNANSSAMTLPITSSSPSTFYLSLRAGSTVSDLIRLFGFNAGEVVTIDNLSLKPLTLSSLFSSVSTSDSDVIADANVTLTSGTQAGLVLNLDSATTPANFVIAYHDGTNVHLEKNVAGTYTSLINTAATYSAGATLRVIKDGTKYRVYYNNALVGTEQTISDAGIISNTKHGLFSTYSGNSFDNFTLWPRGSSATKYNDLPDTNLTATAETTTTYGASTGSTKLVAGSSGSAYSQSVNVGDTSTYTLSAAVYTTGAAITSADVEMYAGTNTIATTFTSLGNGWYRASATVTGVVTPTPYGVWVHSGRTVYVDNLSLIASANLASTFTVQNTMTGLGQMTVESTTTLNSGLSTLQAMIVKGALSQSANLTEWQNSTGSILANLSSSGLLNATVGGVATFNKAGTISDADFTSPVDGLIGLGIDPDTSLGRIYFREGAAWSFVAQSGGFQIPKEEVEGLLAGDFLMPYVDTFMSDGAVHGLYQKFDLNKILTTQGAVTFVSDVTFLGKTKFNKDTAGTAIISTYSNQVDVKFENIYDVAPIVKINLVVDASESAMITDGQKAYPANMSPSGFSIILPSFALQDYKYNWMAINTGGANVTRSVSALQDILGIQAEATPSATLTITP